MVTSEALPLAELLRMWRDRLTPADVGLESYGRRRAVGLRREELAQLAGVSVDYIMRLEQGRSTTPSAHITMALARALQLNKAETALLHGSAGLTPPAAAHMPRQIPPGVQRMMKRLTDLPLAAFTADWTLLESTPLWQALFDSPSAQASPDQNLLVQTFIEESVADIATAHGGPDSFERALVADLRNTTAGYPNDPRLRALLTELLHRSPRFATLWNEGRVAAHQSMTKTVHNRLVGDITLDCDVLVIPGSDVKVVIYTTFGSGSDAEKLDFLRVGALRAAAPLPGSLSS